MAKRKPKQPKTIATLKHDEASRKNIPTAEYQAVMRKEEQSPIQVDLRTPQSRPGPPARLAR